MIRYFAKSRAGFTSVEALAATALASAMMIAVLGILAGIAKKEKLLAELSNSPAWHEHLRRQLEADLRLTRKFRQEAGRVVLVGEGGTTGTAGQRTWLPAEVHYYAVQVRDQSMLLRQELPSLSSAGPAEVMVLGASGMAILPDVTSATTGTGGTLEPVPDGPLPARLRVVVLAAGEESGRSLFDRRLQLY